MILNGKLIAEQIFAELLEQIAKLPKPPKLAVVLVGDNPASLSYIRQKQKAAERLGMDFELFSFEASISEQELVAAIQGLNNNPDITGFIVQLPLPAHINTNAIITAIDPEKDVDGFTAENIGRLFLGTADLISCTPRGVMELLARSNIDVRGKSVTIIGRSNIVGKPLALLMINAGATVTICNSQTKDIGHYTLSADIVVVATGQPKLLTLDMVKPGTVVIDVGFSVVDGKISGDTDYEAIEPTCLITPVPGGVGPMTVAMLMKNTYIATCRGEPLCSPK